jgi:hypothetical protein
MTEATLLTKEDAIPMNTDPYGKEWGIYHQPDSGLYRLGIKDADGLINAPTTYPNVDGHVMMTGAFTGVDLATRELKGYIASAWEQSDTEAAKLSRKNEIASLKAKAAKKDTELQAAKKKAKKKVAKKRS